MKAARDEARPEPEPETVSALAVVVAEDELEDFAADGEAGTLPKRQLRLSDAPARAARTEGVAPAPGRRPALLRAAVVAVAAAALGTAGYLQAHNRLDWRSLGGFGASRAIATGELSVDSAPSGAQVFVDGAAKGTTPLVLSLPEGNHLVEMSLGEARRQRTITVRAGASASHFVEFSSTANSDAAGTGRLEVTADRQGAPVRVDGVVLGVTPLALDAVHVGEHRVTIGEGAGSVERMVKVASNSVATVVATLAGGEAAAAGWVMIRVPVEMQISEGQVVLGTTSAARTMLPAGRHQLQLTSAALNFQTTVSVTIPAGGTTSVAVNLPQGVLSVNAAPWADVSVDGRALGPTPLGNIALPIGTHEVLWRHPTLGERRQSVVVKADAPSRVAVDFTKP